MKGMHSCCVAFTYSHRWRKRTLWRQVRRAVSRGGVDSADTFMAHALEAVAACKVLIGSSSSYSTLASDFLPNRTKGSASGILRYRGTTRSLSHRVGHGGSARIGPDYILEKMEGCMRGRVSWFRNFNGLGTTMGYEKTMTADLNDAAGGLIHQDEKLRCFGCNANECRSGESNSPGQIDSRSAMLAHCHGQPMRTLQRSIRRSGPAIPRRVNQADQALRGPGFQFLRPVSPDPGRKSSPREIRAFANIRFQPYA